MARLKIALIIEASRGYGRELLRGVYDYAKIHGPWSFFVQERRLEDQPPVWIREWHGDGVIARCDNELIQSLVEQTGVPCVDVRGTLPGSMPVVDSDPELVVQIALDHLRERGFRNLAYCGYSTVSYSMRREKIFAQFIKQYGLKKFVYESPAPFPEASSAEIEQHHVIFESQLAAWVCRLPKPVGILACNDIRGQQLLATCRDVDVVVPEQVGVLGVDNDDIICNLSDPPLSSVDLNAHHIGYTAAELLSRMIGGEDHQGDRIVTAPKGVNIRASTDVAAVDDRHVAKALRFIRAHAVEGIVVEDIVKQVPLSRRALERRFKEVLGRTLNSQIVNVRIDRVKELLESTDWSLQTIACRTGFAHSEYLSVAFKRQVGITPGDYRRRHHK